MNTKLMIIVLSMVSAVAAQLGKCDQTPPEALSLTPAESDSIPYRLRILNKGVEGKYLNDQTYVLILETTNMTKPFREFMITAEAPEVDNSVYNFDHRTVNVGNLKTLLEDTKSRYSARCYNSVENTDNANKYSIVIHWVSPEDINSDQEVRFRAMVAENKEVWYEGENLTFILKKDNAMPTDGSPYIPVENCNLCSEARYEVIFQGVWSRGTHPNHYPNKPADNYYSYMIGASHSFDFTLWQQGTQAHDALKKLAETGEIDEMERFIINNMAAEGGTRTLIRGKQRRHPHMSEPSHSLFRVDKVHHLFSIAVAMKPSPDWFLGTSRFELCTENGWLKYHNLTLYPWDAGTMNGISYESTVSITQPQTNVERVEVGSFDKESPFFQMSLIDLKPFAKLEVRRLDVYPLIGVDCSEDNIGQAHGSDQGRRAGYNEESRDEPSLSESRQNKRCLSTWSEWYPCEPFEGVCGAGTRRRERFEEDSYYSRYNDPDDLQVKPLAKCEENVNAPLEDTRSCFLNC